MPKRPGDFEILNKWDSGSLPPPYHSELSLRISNARGEITFLPDYPSDNTPQWAETFQVNDADLDDLFSLLVETGVFKDIWHEASRYPAGGSMDWMTVSAKGKMHSIPAALEAETADRIQKVYSAIRNLIPPPI